MLLPDRCWPPIYAAWIEENQSLSGRQKIKIEIFFVVLGRELCGCQALLLSLWGPKTVKKRKTSNKFWKFHQKQLKSSISRFDRRSIKFYGVVFLAGLSQSPNRARFILITKTWSTHAIWWHSVTIYTETSFHDCKHLNLSASKWVKSMHLFCHTSGRSGWCTGNIVHNYRDKIIHIFENANSRTS